MATIIKEIIEILYEEEMKEHPGYEKHSSEEKIRDNRRRTASSLFFDVSKYIESELHTLGVPTNHIERDPNCTICNPTFHSHRRDKEHAGRALVFAVR